MFALLFSSLAAAQCGTADAIAAMRGEIAAPHPGMLTPPARVGRPAAAPPPAAGKSVYGTNYEHHLDTENFTINWWIDDIPEDTATRAGEALETAWTAFIEEQGWRPPVSSDTYYIWVLLDPSLGSMTGYTVEYFTDEYGEGYPIIYLNPDWDYDDAFWAALAAHEFMHTLQFALREWDYESTTETWYWEASATWSSELADPEVDGHQYCSAWYAEQPGLRYDSTTGSHQYGIFVFNAWLEEHLTGAGGMRAVWELGEDREGSPWDEILAESTGVSAGELWAGFTGAYGNEQLAESSLYTAPTRQGRFEDGASGELPYLGTDYWYVVDAATVAVEGDAILSAASGTGTELAVGEREILAVTALSDDVAYTLRLVSDTDTGGDTGDDTGEADSAAEDSASDTGEPKAAACGCASAQPAGAWAAALLALAARRRIRRAGRSR